MDKFKYLCILVCAIPINFHCNCNKNPAFCFCAAQCDCSVRVPLYTTVTLCCSQVTGTPAVLLLSLLHSQVHNESPNAKRKRGKKCMRSTKMSPSLHKVLPCITTCLHIHSVCLFTMLYLQNTLYLNTLFTTVSTTDSTQAL